MTLSVSWHESPPPTAATPRTDRATFGADVAETARMLGVPFMGWQSLAADRAMEHEGGRLAYREVDLSIDRQAGKSHADPRGGGASDVGGARIGG